MTAPTDPRPGPAAHGGGTDIRGKDITMQIQLGDRVRDRISGFEGIVIGITDWLYQCRRPIVQPSSLHEGRPTESQSFDEDQLEILERGAFKPKAVENEPASATKTGGPRDTPTRRPDPGRR